MNDLSPQYQTWAGERLNAHAAEAIMREAGVEAVSVKERLSGKLWIYFKRYGRGYVWGLRLGTLTQHFVREVAREFATKH